MDFGLNEIKFKRNDVTFIKYDLFIYIKKFKFIEIFGTLQVGIRAQLEWIKQISVCSDLKFAALNVFKTIFINKLTKQEKCLKTGNGDAVCTISRGQD